MARIDEWGLTTGVTAAGALCYAGGREIARDMSDIALKSDSRFRALNMKKPVLANCIKNYPKVLKTAGALGVIAGAAGLTYCIFDEFNKK